MTPIEFVVYGGDSQPNTPVYRIAEAMQLDCKVVGPKGEMEILSYYFDPDSKSMVLEVGYV
jgi:hypothetical protein